MIDIIILIFVFAIGLATGFLDAVIGSGGLVSIPSLIFIGLPPQVAIATDRLGTIGQHFGSLPKFWKEKKIIWKYVPPFALISIIGTYVGANILLNVDPNILTKLVGIIVLSFLPLVFIKRNLGIKRKETTKTKKTIGHFFYFFVMVYAAFIGGGSGLLIFYTLMIFFGFTVIDSIATSSIPWFLLSIFSLIIFSINGIVDYTIGIVLFISMLLGGYIGAHVAIKKGNKWVKSLFAIVVIISGIKLLFF